MCSKTNKIYTHYMHFWEFLCPKNICFRGCAPDRPLSLMQVNLYGSPCIPGVFLYCFGHRKKRNLAPKMHKNTPFWPQNLKRNFWERGNAPAQIPPPVGRGPVRPLTLIPCYVCVKVSNNKQRFLSHASQSPWHPMHFGCIFFTVLVIQKSTI